MKYREVRAKLLAPAALVIAGLVGASCSASPSVPVDDVRRDVTAAVSAVAPEVLAAAAAVPTDGGAATIIDTATAEVPSDPADGVRLGGDAGQVVVGLPNGDHAADGVVVKAGVVAYDNNDGSATLVVTEGAGLSMTTVIDSPDAPTRYRYQVDVPAGASLRPTDEGGVDVVAHDGSVLASAAPPWAKDANGAPVATRYEVNGTTLVQVVEHRDSAVVLPVLADPWWGWQWKLSSTSANRLASLMNTGAGISGIASAICSGTIVGLPCGVAFVIAAGLLGIGGGVIGWCNAKGRGININRAWNGTVWCTSR